MPSSCIRGGSSSIWSSWPPRPALGADHTDLLLQAATDAELQPLISPLVSPHVETRAAWTFWVGTLDGKTVALSRTEGIRSMPWPARLSPFGTIIPGW